jgi:hypothetical protein
MDGCLHFKIHEEGIALVRYMKAISYLSLDRSKEYEAFTNKDCMLTVPIETSNV